MKTVELMWWSDKHSGSRVTFASRSSIILAAISILILSDLSEAVMRINSLNLCHSLCDILQCVDV